MTQLIGTGKVLVTETIYISVSQVFKSQTASQEERKMWNKIVSGAVRLIKLQYFDYLKEKEKNKHLASSTG